MKFMIYSTEFSHNLGNMIREYPYLENKIEIHKALNDNNHDYATIEINTLEELIELIRNTLSVYVIDIDNENDYPILEIYDYWRE